MKSWLLASMVALASAYAAVNATAASMDISSNWSGYAVTGIGSSSTVAASTLA